jgi:hypothetical protein
MVRRYALCAGLLGQLWVEDRLAAIPTIASPSFRRIGRRIYMWYYGNGSDAKAAAAARQDQMLRKAP